MEHSAQFQFYGRLQPLLVRPDEEGKVSCAFNQNPAVKDAVEALGIPHTEVDALAVNGACVSFDYHLQDTDQVAVYPHGWSQIPPDPVPLVPPPPEPPRFILDVHLGKLARRLRMLGFDCLYRNDYADAEIVEIACREQRIILTRDRGLLKRKKVVWGCLMDGDHYPEQLQELEVRYGLLAKLNPLGRCPICNGLLQAIEKEQIRDRLEPKTLLYYSEFRNCVDCGQIYWRGSHAEKVFEWIERLAREQPSKNDTET